jgi:hypothetical protein
MSNRETVALRLPDEIKSIKVAVILANSHQAGWIAGSAVSDWLTTWGTAQENPMPCR